MARLVWIALFVGIFWAIPQGWAQQPDYMREAPEKRMERAPEGNRPHPEEMGLPGVHVVRDEDIERLERREAELVDQIAELNRQAEKTPEDTPEGKGLREKIDRLVHELEDVRAAKAEISPERRESESMIQDLERVLDEQNRKLRALEERRADPEQIEEVRRKAEALREKIERIREPGPPPPFPPEHWELAVFVLEHVPAEHVAELTRELIGAAAIVIGDPWSNKLFARGEPSALPMIEVIVRHIDVPRKHIEGMEWAPPHEEEEEAIEHPEEAEREEAEREVREEQGEHPTLVLVLEPSEKADSGLEIFAEERSVSLEDVAQRLSHLDHPDLWTLKILIRRGIPKESLHAVLDELEAIAKERGLGNIQIED